MSEVKLATTRQERQLFDNLSDLYSIILTMEHVETAFVRDAISTDEYSPACEKLIAQFKTVKETVHNHYPNLEKFMADYRLQCPAAAKRFKTGVPVNVEHRIGKKGDEKEGITVAQTVQHFITTLDSLKLEMHACDELHPHVKDLMDSLQRITRLDNKHIAKINAKKWLEILNSMRASDKLTADQAREMSFDLEKAYNAFYSFLGEESK